MYYKGVRISGKRDGGELVRGEGVKTKEADVARGEGREWGAGRRETGEVLTFCAMSYYLLVSSRRAANNAPREVLQYSVLGHGRFS